jgi:hypothetical protein
MDKASKNSERSLSRQGAGDDAHAHAQATLGENSMHPSPRIPARASCRNIVPAWYFEAMTDNIRTMRTAASAAHRLNGARWYRRTAQFCKIWADAFNRAGWAHITPLHIGAILAAHSSNTPWDRNIILASRQMRATLFGTARICRSRVSILVVGDDGSERKRSVKCEHYGTTTMHPVHTLSDNTDKAARIMLAQDADAIARILSPDGDNIKTVAFAYACSGDYSHAVIDRHAHRIAYGYSHCKNTGRPCNGSGKHNCGWVPVRDEYRAIAQAYAVVASEFGEPVAFTQAITWVATREFNS